MLEAVKNDLVSAFNSDKITVLQTYMRDQKGNVDVFGMFLILIEKYNHEIKLQWRKNYLHPEVLDVFYQEKRNHDYKYGGTALPTLGLINALKLSDEIVTEICFEDDTHKLMELIKQL